MEPESKKTAIEGVNIVYTLVKWNDWNLLRFFDRMGFKKGDMIGLELKIRCHTDQYNVLLYLALVYNCLYRDGLKFVLKFSPECPILFLKGDQ